MASLLNSLLVTLSILAILNPPINPLPLLALSPELSSQNELRRKQHHAIGHRDVIANQEFAAALVQRGFEIIHVLAYVH